MKTVNDPTAAEITITFARHQSAGYGHREIEVDINYNGVEKSFKAVTNNMPDFDAATDQEGEEKYFALYRIIESDIEERIVEWIQDLKEA